MRWVIVGSSGYIGSALCRYLIAAGYSVLSVSRQSKGPSGASHCQVRNYDSDECRDLFVAGDKVIYTAGLSSAKDCRRNPELADRLNCQIPQLLLRAAGAVHAESFLYLSSVKAVIPRDHQLSGELDGEPATDVYGRSKWRAERALLTSTSAIRVNVLRPAAVYGEYEGTGVLTGGKALLIDAAAVKHKRAFVWRRRFRVWGRYVPLIPASGYRSFVALEDLLSAIQLIAESRCDRETFISAEPQYCDLGMIASAASGRRIKSSQIMGALLLAPARLLSVLGVKTGFLDVARSELYSSARIKVALNWQPVQRYSQYLRGGNGES